MDHKTLVREFLQSRRARITPDQAGIIGGGRRRVLGLRREEVAMLAGVSVDYYAQLERGDLSRASSEVLHAICRALQLDEAETSHLIDLAQAAQRHPVMPQMKSESIAASPTSVRPSLRRFLEMNDAVPMWVRDERLDFVIANQLGRALNSPIFEDESRPANAARFVFLNESAARRFYPDWEHVASDIVATLGLYAGQRANDEQFTALIDELSSSSEAFRSRWGEHDVRFHQNGIKRIHHPIVGELELIYEAFTLPADPGWHMFAFTATAGSDSEEGLRMLADWAYDREQDAEDSVTAFAPQKD